MKLNPDWLALSSTQKLIKAFADAGKAGELRFVGGAVRDALLGINAEDIDAATSLLPEETTQLLEKSAIRVIPTGIKHGTVTALIDGKSFEITTLRSDISCDGRHAEVAFTNDWQEDAARRDFTMNALYLGTDGELFDYFGGMEDARTGHVRFIGNSKERITEDYLRILRFFRFFANYGKGEIDKEGLAACFDFALMTENLSGERIAHEMLKLLAAPKAFTALKFMQISRVLEQICGFAIHLKNAMKRIPSNSELNLTLLLLSADITPADALIILANRWRLSNGLKKTLSLLINHVNDISIDLPIAQQKHLLRTLGAEVFSSLIILKQALEPQENYQVMLRLISSWQPPKIPVCGDDLLKLGIKQGKELGEKLHKLEILWEESDYTLTKEDLLKLLIT